MSLHHYLRKLVNGPVVWRYLDAFAPRIFGLIFHSFILHRFGGPGYALPAWIFGIFNLILGPIPDPHGFILVRGHGDRARRLLSLATPYLLAKTLLAVIVTVLCVPFLVSSSLIEAQAGNLILLTLGATIYSATEALWGVLGTVSLALGNVRRVAIAAVGTRLLGLGILLVLDQLPQISVSFYILGYTLPLMLSCILFFPFQLNISRIILFANYAIRRYGLWSQGISLTTMALAQLAPISMGMFDGVSAQQVGQIAYINRLLLAALVPLQVLQSVVIHGYSRGEGAVSTHYRKIFKFSGVALFGFGGYQIWHFSVTGRIEPRAALATTLILLGVAISCWFRFEISVILASTRIRELLVRGYLPVLAGAVILTYPAGKFFGVVGLGALTLAAWCGISISWMWISTQPQRRPS
ncbi:hypothetical protein [Holophaga foetida]|uniref:hypothetical protein n=1 Tax=Holophaga foetida TaxID=35839 RepID=UPI0002473F3D|nr:hypothetical protein [Holophaga foetida]